MKTTYRSRTGHERYKLSRKNSNGMARARRIGALKRWETYYIYWEKRSYDPQANKDLVNKKLAHIKEEMEAIKKKL